MNSKYILNNHPALGSYFWIEVFEDLPNEIIQEIREYIEKEIFIFESLYSRFKRDSLVTKLNSERFLDNPPSDLISMINFSQEIANLTNNTFNICLGSHLDNSGYDSMLSFEEKLSEPEIIPMNEAIKIFENQIFLVGNSKVDLGGIGKGFLVDKISKILKNKFHIKYFLINGGGDIFVTSNNENPVEISLQNPVNADEFIGSIFLMNQSICGSSPHKRKWYGSITQKEYTHIIDPSNKNKLNSSFVSGSSAVLCDSLATVLCIDEDVLENYPHVDYLVFDKNGLIIKNTF